jgi:hypothetical protein
MREVEQLNRGLPGAKGNAEMTANHLNKERVQAVITALPSLTGQGPQIHFGSESLQQLLADYFRVVEVAHYLHRGGVKAMIYRLETGKAEFDTADYFDEAHERLTKQYAQAYTTAQANSGSLLERLRDITQEEEETVRHILPELENILLQHKRLEAILGEENRSVQQ